MCAVRMLLGLGNPGARYQSTRHNVGFDLLDGLAERSGVRFRRALFQPYRYAVAELIGGRVVFCKPMTFMNRSGEVLAPVMRRFGVDPADILVVTDNMDLPPGTIRFRNSGGQSTHNGLKSVIATLGHTEFARLYVGVGRPAANASVVEHVLGHFGAEDKALVKRAMHRCVETIVGSPDFETVTLQRTLNFRIESLDA